MRKGTTLLSNEGYSLPCGFQNSGPTQGCQNVTGCRPPASAHMLWDSGELRSLTKRDSSFPHSTPGAVPSVPMCIHELISLSKPVYGQAGGLRETQKTILNIQCINHSHQGEGDPREECNGACSPNLELKLLLDPTLIPDPCLTVSQEKGAPDDNCLPFYTAHEARDDIHDDARLVSSNIIHHHEP